MVVTRKLLALACTVVVLWGLVQAREYLVPIIFAAFMAALAAPAVFWLIRKKVPGGLAIGLVCLGFVIGFSALGGLLGESLSSVAERLPELRERARAIESEVLGWLQARGVHVSAGALLSTASASDVVGVAGSVLSGVAALLTNVTGVLLILIFLLVEALVAAEKLEVALGHAPGQKSARDRIIAGVKRYIITKSYVCAGTGLAIGVLLWLFDIQFAVLWGLLAFLLNYVPNIGLIIAAFIPGVVTFALQGLWPAIAVGGIFVSVGMVVGYGVEPALLGRRLGLSAFSVFMCLIFWGALWGPAGMFLAVPLTVLIKLLLEASPKTAWLSVLMDGPPRGRVLTRRGFVKHRDGGDTGDPPP